MTTISSRNPPPGIAAATSITATGGTSAAAAASLLPDPAENVALSSDPAVALAQLSVKNGTEQRRMAEESRATQEQLERQQDDLEVEAMRQKAADIRTGGILEGVGMIAAGGLTLAASGASDGLGKDLRGFSQLSQALGNLGGAMKKADEASDDATATEHRAAADQAKQAADGLRDAQKNGQDFVSAAIDFYREYASAKSSEQSAALHRS